MSTKRQHDIGCPFCGREQTAELWDAIDAGQDPELRTALLAGQINRVTCAGCGKNFRIEKALVYHDREQEILVHYEPLASGITQPQAEQNFREALQELARLLPPDLPAWETHLVLTWNELIERIYLLEEGLDARLVEHIKYMLYQQNPAKLPAKTHNLLFNAQDSTADQLCFVVQERATHKLQAVLNFARADYEALVNVFDSDEQLALLDEQFPGPYYNARQRFLRDQRDAGE